MSVDATSSNRSPSALRPSNLVHTKKFSYEQMQKEIALRLHRANEQIILQMQEISLENQEFTEFFKLSENTIVKKARDGSVDDDEKEQVLGS